MSEKGKTIAEQFAEVADGQPAEMQPIKPNIQQRMLAIMRDVDYVVKEKSKAKEGLPHPWVKHDAVVGLIRPAMVKYGVTFAASSVDLVSQNSFVWHTKYSDKDVFKTIVKLRGYFFNVDDPEDKVYSEALGEGVDGADKGIGKAISYAKKNLLLLHFLLETGEDPEREYNGDNQRPNGKKGKKEKPIGISEKDEKMVSDVLKESMTEIALTDAWKLHMPFIKAATPEQRKRFIDTKNGIKEFIESSGGE